MNDEKGLVAWLSSGIAMVFTSVQPDVVLQYVSLALTIISVLVSVAFSLWRWWKEAKKDGKLTDEEIEEGLKIISKGVEDMKEASKDKDGKSND